jgi:hypothetical protein
VQEEQKEPACATDESGGFFARRVSNEAHGFAFFGGSGHSGRACKNISSAGMGTVDYKHRKHAVMLGTMSSFDLSKVARMRLPAAAEQKVEKDL